ncbi:MAG TPA: hypothetical protein VH417_11315 [Vicinamibacterales bacterium]|jgi:hypothetical protein
MRVRAVLIGWLLGTLGAAASARAEAVVTNGRFTNIYVLPDPDRETWDAHFKRVDPARAADFTRAKIDAFTDALMAPRWPGYFDALRQYGVHPARFFGSGIALQDCVDRALKDVKNGVIQSDTIRSLANCHPDGLDPSPQINLIFSPDLKVAHVLEAEDMCTKPGDPKAYHFGGLNVPNYAVISTNSHCAGSFDTLTKLMSHEIVEILTDPNGTGHGGLGGTELADKCEDVATSIADPRPFLIYRGYQVERYFSDFDHRCEPHLEPPPGDASVTWEMGSGSPLIRFTGSVHTLTRDVPSAHATTGATADVIRVFVQTGDDDLRAGNNASDNARVALRFRHGGTPATGPLVPLNGTRRWGNGETHMVVFNRAELPSDLKVSEITGVTIATQFGGGLSGDNWDVDKVALQVTFAEGSTVSNPPQPIVHDWADDSGAPLVRFTGDRHQFAVPLSIPKGDLGAEIAALELSISTGNDDLRGGTNPGDNCTVEIALAKGSTVTPIGPLHDVNHHQTWEGWSTHTVNIPVPPGFRGRDLAGILLKTGFGGGIGGDNWNVNRVELRATLK